MRPTPTLRFFSEACFARSSIRREVGPSAVTGFSMNTLSFFSIAYWKCTQRKASGVVKMDVAGTQGINGVLVAIEADEFAVVRHIDLAGHGTLLQSVKAAVETVLEHIRHGHEFN